MRKRRIVGVNIEELFDYCLSVKDAEATSPFDEVTIVMKVMGRMFALIPTDAERCSVSLKCDPEEALRLRQQYGCVEAAFHMNKTHWNRIWLEGDMPDHELKRWIDHSVEQVIGNLSKKKQREYYGTTE